MRHFSPLIVSALLLLAGCGGGGGGDDREDPTPSPPAPPPVSNSAPTAHAGSDRTIAVGALVDLDGSASMDPDQDSLTFSWAITDLPEGSTASLSSTTEVRPQIRPDRPGTYTVRLTVSDGQASASDSVALDAQALVGILLEGNPDAPAVDAIVDLLDNSAAPLLTDPTGSYIAEALDLRISEVATVREVNEVLERLGARIVSMAVGSTNVTVRTAPFRTDQEADELIAAFESSPAIEAALKIFVPQEEALPPAYGGLEYGLIRQPSAGRTWSSQQVRTPINEAALPTIDHLLATHASALWNAKDLYRPPETRPVRFMIVDGFQSGPPPDDSVFAVTMVNSRFLGSAPSARAHGYQVLSLARAAWRADSPVSGVFPFQRAPTTACDFNAFRDCVTQMFQTVRGLNDTLGVMNLSWGRPCTANETRAQCVARIGKHARGIILDWRSLERKVLVVVSAGNYALPLEPGWQPEAALAGEWKAAALYDQLIELAKEVGWLDTSGRPVVFDSSGQPRFNPYEKDGRTILRPLSNVLVVGSRTLVLPKERARGAVFGCLAETSSTHAAISVVGHPVYAYETAAGAVRDNRGTSFAAPQVAALAEMLLALPIVRDDSDDPIADVMNMIKMAALSAAENCQRENTPVVDLYKALLLADRALEPGRMPVRNALLDVTNGTCIDTECAPRRDGATELWTIFDVDRNNEAESDGRVTDTDVVAILHELSMRNGLTVDHSRYDLNGDGKTGGAHVTEFDLDLDGAIDSAPVRRVFQYCPNFFPPTACNPSGTRVRTVCVDDQALDNDRDPATCRVEKDVYVEPDGAEDALYFYVFDERTATDLDVLVYYTSGPPIQQNFQDTEDHAGRCLGDPTDTACLSEGEW